MINPSVLLSAVHSFQLLLVIMLLPLQLYCSLLWRDIVLPVPTCALFLYYETAAVAISVPFGSSSVYWGHLIQDFCFGNGKYRSCAWIGVTVSLPRSRLLLYVWLCFLLLVLFWSPHICSIQQTYQLLSWKLHSLPLFLAFYYNKWSCLKLFLEASHKE